MFVAHDQYAAGFFDVNTGGLPPEALRRQAVPQLLDKAKRFMDLRMSSKLTGRLMDLVREHMRRPTASSPRCSRSRSEAGNTRWRGRHPVPPRRGNYLCLKMKDRQFLYRMTMNAVSWTPSASCASTAATS